MPKTPDHLPCSTQECRDARYARQIAEGKDAQNYAISALHRAMHVLEEAAKSLQNYSPDAPFDDLERKQ